MTDGAWTHAQFADELFQALRLNHTVPPLRNRAALTIDDAYRISLGLLARREAELQTSAWRIAPGRLSG